MKYRNLGDAGMKVSEISLGGWLTFGNAIEEKMARDLIARAFDLGINFFDTADVYAEGRCEEVWGEILRVRKRSDYVLASKAFFPMGDGPNDRGLSRKHIMESCETSLKRLRTHYLDLYQCHRADEQTPLEETVRAMDDLIHQGKVCYWGFSEWPAETIEKCLQVCGERFYKPKSSQPQYNAIQRQAEQKVIPVCAKAGIGQIVFSPLAQGVLTGKYKPDQSFPADSRALDDRQNQFIKRMANDQTLLQKVQRLEPVAKEANVSMGQLALAWILRRPEVSSCIVGATKVKQLEENAKASGVKLDDAIVRQIDEILN